MEKMTIMTTDDKSKKEEYARWLGEDGWYDFTDRHVNSTTKQPQIDRKHFVNTEYYSQYRNMLQQVTAFGRQTTANHEDIARMEAQYARLARVSMAAGHGTTNLGPGEALALHMRRCKK